MSPRITVVGVGGAGGNAVNNMITSNLEGVEFVICNTDAQAIEGSLCETRIQLGVTVTGGLGAGARPEIGRAAAEESLDEVMQHMDGSNMVFITAGMGGGTGTGAAPVIARACRERGILTVGVVTKPFHFEGSLRMKMAEEGIRQMQEFVDTLIVIPNQNLFRVANEKTTFAEAFKMADSVLQAGVRGVTDLMVMPALINLDFADIRTAMMEMGKAMMGMGEGVGDKRAIDAAEAAINNPLLDDVSMKGARGVIINVTGGGDMTLFEVDEACNRIREEVDPNANIIFGATFDEKMEGVMRVSIVATGIDVAETQKRGSAGSSMSNSMLNVLTSAQQQERKIDRSRPNATSVEVAEASAPAPVSRPAASIPAQQHAYAPAVRQPVNPIPSAPVNVGSAAMARRAEEDQEMFEQAEFAAQNAAVNAPVQQYTASQAETVSFHSQRGMRYNDAFIPPAAVEVQQVQAPVQQAHSNFALRPPVPAPVQSSGRKRAQSLFERFTQGLRHEDTEDDGTTDTGSAGGNAGGGLRAQSRQNSYQAAPQQGSLNIEAPVATRPGQQVDDELDIPAFLRRQAN